MQLKDVYFENDNKRIDSEYFKKQFLSFFESVPNLKPLGSFVKDGYRVVYENTKIIDPSEAIEKNCPIFLQATDITTPFISVENLYYVDNSDWDRYPKGRIIPGEILIEVKGKIEKVAIVPDDFPKKTLVTGSLFKLSINKNISKNVLLTYLISKYGTAFKDRYKTNLLISFISKPDLYRIPVPDFSQKLQNDIDKLFKIITTSKKISLGKYSQAEKLLIKELKLSDSKISKENTNTISLKESFLKSGRLDAEYYQPKYEDYFKIIKKNALGFSLLNKICEIQDTNFTPDDDLTYKYIELSNIGSTGEITGCSTEVGKELPSRARRLIKKGDVIVSSIEGSLQSCAIIPDQYDDSICSTGFYVVKSDIINSETLLVLFKSELIQNILKQNCSGTILTAINKNEFLNLPLPLIANDIQKEISNLVQESFRLKNQSEKLLQVAKRAVEMAIEQDEDTAMEFINKNT